MSWRPSPRPAAPRAGAAHDTAPTGRLVVERFSLTEGELAAAAEGGPGERFSRGSGPGGPPRAAVRGARGTCCRVGRCRRPVVGRAPGPAVPARPILHSGIATPLLVQLACSCSRTEL